MKLPKFIIRCILAVLVIFIVSIIGGSFYMLDYSLSPDPERTDTAQCFREQFKTYPETQPWIDSLRKSGAIRDTFVTMPTGEKHHALFIRKGGNKTAMVLHGWHDCSIDFLWLARIYEKELGYNVVIPDLHAHGLSEGDMIQMGWLDRKDALYWLSMFQSDTMAVHGVSMGAADTFVPTDMLHRLYDAKTSNKEFWITEGAEHAESYLKHRKEYVKRLKDFLSFTAL